MGDSFMMSELLDLPSIYASVLRYDLTMEFGCCYSDIHSFNALQLHLISDGGSMSLLKSSRVSSGSHGELALNSLCWQCPFLRKPSSI